MQRLGVGLAVGIMLASGVPPAGAQLAPQVAGKVAFSRFVGGDSEIFIINADGTGLIQLTHNRANDFEPAWSPDGRHVAYVRDWRKGRPPAIKIAALSGGKPRTVYACGDDLYEPQWSPNGKWIAFEEDVGIDGSDVTAHSVDGHRTRSIVVAQENSENGDIEWSPDGTSFAYVERDGGGTIYVKSFGSGWSQGVPVLRTNGIRGNSLAWAPDGETLLFSDVQRPTFLLPDEDTSSNIYSVPLAGGEAELIVGGPSEEIVGDWSPDGKHFIFVSDERGSFDLYISSSDGGTIRPLTSFEGNEWGPAWWGRS